MTCDLHFSPADVRGLESLGVSSNQYGSLLISVIMSKLPHEIRVQVASNTAREVWEMSELLEVIRQEVEARGISEGSIPNRKGHLPRMLSSLKMTRKHLR